MYYKRSYINTALSLNERIRKDNNTTHVFGFHFPINCHDNSRYIEIISRYIEIISRDK